MKNVIPALILIFLIIIFQLNDCLLYTSYSGTVAGLKINYELPLSGMKVFVPMADDCGCEFSIISITRSFTLKAK